MIIETKFNNGDSVYYTNSERELIRVKTCKSCGGNGELELLNGGVIQCTSCWGRGGESRELWLIKPSDSPSKIGRVDVIIYCKISKNRKDEMNYMLHATGIGSGALHKENHVFTTLEECTEYCDIENEKRRIEFSKEYEL